MELMPGAAELAEAFARDGVTFAPRRWRTSPPFNGLDDELSAGADLDHPLFPIVWPADG